MPSTNIFIAEKHRTVKQNRFLCREFLNVEKSPEKKISTDLLELFLFTFLMQTFF